MERPLENQSRYLLSAGSWTEGMAHAYILSTISVKFYVCPARNKKEQIFIITKGKHLMRGGWGIGELEVGGG